MFGLELSGQVVGDAEHILHRSFPVRLYCQLCHRSAGLSITLMIHMPSVSRTRIGVLSTDATPRFTTRFVVHMDVKFLDVLLLAAPFDWAPFENVRAVHAQLNFVSLPS